MTARRVKTAIARLLEVWALDEGIELEGLGSWTVRDPQGERGVEPDECYLVGDHPAEVPDLAIEVHWTAGGLDKLEIYRGLGVKEVWIWSRGALQVHVLKRGRYVRARKSTLLPKAPLELLARLATMPRQTEALRVLREPLGRAARKRD